MKNKFILVCILFFVLIISGCSNNISENSINKLYMNMTKKELESELGKPDYKTSDRTELENEFHGSTSVYLTQLEFEEDQEVIDSSMGYSEYAPVNDAIEAKQKVEVYQYDIEELHYLNAYFIEDELKFFYNVDLNTNE